MRACTRSSSSCGSRTASRVARRRRPRSGSLSTARLRNALQRNDSAPSSRSSTAAPRATSCSSDSTRSLLVDSPCVSIDMLYVAPRPPASRAWVARCCRRAPRYADRQGAEHVASARARAGPRRQPLLRPPRLRAGDGAPGRPPPRRCSASWPGSRARSGVAIDQVLPRRRDLRGRASSRPTRVAG